jgi:hypothetical protein
LTLTFGRIHWQKEQNRYCSKAFAKNISTIGLNKDWEEINLFTQHFTIAPAEVSVKPHTNGGQGYVTPIDSIGYKSLNAYIRNRCTSHSVRSRKYSIVTLFEKELKTKLS